MIRWTDAVRGNPHANALARRRDESHGGDTMLAPLGGRRESLLI
jgi:hypothetical protein